MKVVKRFAVALGAAALVIGFSVTPSHAQSVCINVQLDVNGTVVGTPGTVCLSPDDAPGLPGLPDLPAPPELPGLPGLPPLPIM